MLIFYTIKKKRVDVTLKAIKKFMVIPLFFIDCRPTTANTCTQRCSPQTKALAPPSFPVWCRHPNRLPGLQEVGQAT